MSKRSRRTAGRSESMPATIRMRLSLSGLVAWDLKSREEAAGFGQLTHYLSFGPQVEATKRKLLLFLISARQEGKRVVGYGAPAKGNTLLNYCGVRTDLIDYTVDRSPHKQGHFLPGVHIPIYAPERIRQTRPDYVLILPWNLRAEVMQQMAFHPRVGREGSSWCLFRK